MFGFVDLGKTCGLVAYYKEKKTRKQKSKRKIWAPKFLQLAGAFNFVWSELWRRLGEDFAYKLTVQATNSYNMQVHSNLFGLKKTWGRLCFILFVSNWYIHTVACLSFSHARTLLHPYVSNWHIHTVACLGFSHTLLYPFVSNWHIHVQ